MNGCFYAALARIPLGLAVTLEFLGPLGLSALLSRQPRDILAAGWALTGVALLGGGHSIVGTSIDPAGVFYALLAGVAWALYILAATRVGATIPGISGVAVATLVGAVVVLPFGIYGASTVFSHLPVLGLALVTAIITSVVPYSLELMAIRQLPARTFGILLSLEPAMAALMGWLLLNQSIHTSGVLGIVMVITASISSRGKSEM